MSTTVADKSQEAIAFGLRLRALREAASLSQGELAERVGKHYQAIARYERGDREPSWGIVLAFAEALGVTPDAFLEEDQGDEKPTRKPRGK